MQQNQWKSRAEVELATLENGLTGSIIVDYSAQSEICLQ